jgi:uncharacterized protein with beta-barrel porin domain
MMVRRIALLVVAGSVAAGIVAAGSTAWAHSKDHSVNVTLSTPTIVEGQRIPAGDYRLSWEGTTSPAEVTFKEGSKVVAKVDAKIVQRPKSENEEVISRTMKDGTRALEEVRLGDKTTALVFKVS